MQDSEVPRTELQDKEYFGAEMSDEHISWDMRNRVVLLYGKWKLSDAQYYTMTRTQIKRLVDVLLKFESGMRISVVSVVDKE